jgi:protein required for attachment to host cells
MSTLKENLNSGEIWVLVANASRADIYSRHKKRGPLEVVQCLTEDLARAKEQELVADEPGRAYDSGGQGRHAMEPQHSEKEHLLTSFAQRIAHMLETARQSGRFAQLIIIAAPAMLGKLRGCLDDVTAECVTAEFSKDLTDRNPETIAKLLDA